MAKKKLADTQIMGKYCKGCKYLTIFMQTNSANDNVKTVVHCGARNKDYIYGQRVPCDDKEVK